MFTPKKDISEFIDNNELNSRLYSRLLSIPVPSTFIDALYPPVNNALSLFNRAYRICDQLENSKNPEELIVLLRDKTIDDFSWGDCDHILSMVYIILCFSDTNNNRISFCLSKLKNIISAVYFEHYATLLNVKDEIKLFSMSFEEIKEKADRYLDINKKNDFYIKALGTFERRNRSNDIVEKIKDEIKAISSEINFKQDNSIGHLSNQNNNKTALNKKKKDIYLSETKGMRVDFIRVINVLCELGFFVDSQGKKSTKKDVFATFGECVNRDFKNYQNDLSTTFASANSDLNSVYRIFEDMLNKQEELNQKALEKKAKK